MDFHRMEKEKMLVGMNVYEIVQLSKLLEEANITRENMKLLYDLDQLIFAYYRDLEDKSQ